MKPNYISQHFQLLLEKYNLKKITTENIYVHFNDSQKIKSANAISDIIPEVKI